MEKDLRDSELFEEKFQWKERRDNGRFFLVVGLVFVLLFSLVFTWRQNFGGVEVDGASMNRTLSNGDKLLMRYTNASVKAERGDVIVVDVRGYEEFDVGVGEIRTNFLIKRLIAVEGDSLYCEDGDIFIRYAGATDFVKLQEDYVYFEGNGKTKADCDFALYEVGAGEVFFLGDNRNNSRDSRFQESNSRLNCLYKESDIYGIVPEWAIEHKNVLEKIFFAWQ